MISLASLDSMIHYLQQLEAELKKIQQLIAEAEQAFNDLLKMLFTKKLKIEMVICQEELKILRLQWGLMFEQSLQTSEQQLIAAIEHKKQLKVCYSCNHLNEQCYHCWFFCLKFTSYSHSVCNEYFILT